MRVLLLVNSAPEVLRWVKNIHAEISKKYETIVVSDSHYTNDMLAVHDIQAHYCFSDYFRNNFNESIDEEAFLKKFGHINIWKSYYPDFERNELYFGFRYKSKDYHKKLLINLYYFFDEIIVKNNIKAIIYENVSNSYAYSAYNVGKLYNVEFLGIVMSRLPKRFELFNGKHISSDTYIKEYNNFLKNDVDESIAAEAEMYVNNFSRVVHNADPFTHPSVSFSKRYFASNRIRNFYIKFKSLRWALRGESFYAYQLKNPLIQSLLNVNRFIKRKIRLMFVNRHYSSVDLNDKFFLYPLHFHPESTTSVQSPHYLNEIEVIQNIAINLPFGHYLYVKDHPSNVGDIGSAFYKRISMIPNVKLIPFHHNSKELIPRSAGVITLTGTVGFEALILNKPIVILGDVFYEQHPLCFKAKNYNEVWSFCQLILKGSLPKSSSMATAYALFKMTYKYPDNEVGLFAASLLDQLKKSIRESQIREVYSVK